MLFVEEHARFFLILHAILAFALVASSTHLVLWLRPFARGEMRRRKATVRFAWITLALYLGTFVLGNVVYPVYKIRVRLQFLENATAITQELELRQGASERTLEMTRQTRLARTGHDVSATIMPSTPPEIAVREGAVTARWFDVKEHFVTLGLLLATAVAISVTAWRPREHGLALAKPLFVLSVGASLLAWLALIIGLMTASYRSLGAL